MADGLLIVPAVARGWDWPGEWWPGGGGDSARAQGPQVGGPHAVPERERKVPRRDGPGAGCGPVRTVPQNRPARVRLAIHWTVAMSKCPHATRQWLKQGYGELVRRALDAAAGFTGRKQQKTVALDLFRAVKVVALAGGRVRLSFRFAPQHSGASAWLVVKHEVEMPAWRP